MSNHLELLWMDCIGYLFLEFVLGLNLSLIFSPIVERVERSRDEEYLRYSYIMDFNACSAGIDR